MAPQKIAHVKYGWIFRRIRKNNTFPLAYAERGKIAKDEHVSVGQRDRSFTKKGDVSRYYRFSVYVFIF